MAVASFSAFVLLFLTCVEQAHAGAIDLSLGSLGSFAVLAGSTVTNTGSTVVNGDLGLWPGTAVTGFPPGIINNGAAYNSDPVALQAQSDLTLAFDSAAGETPTRDLTGTNLGGLTLTSGVYSFSTFADLTGSLTLNAQNNANAVFVFQIGSTLTTGATSTIKLLNGASGGHIFWEVGSSATLGTNSVFDGSILALTSITLDTGANIDCGRALARNGAVTLEANTISENIATCSAPPSVPEPSSALLAMPASFSIIGFALTRRRQGKGKYLGSRSG